MKMSTESVNIVPVLKKRKTIFEDTIKEMMQAEKTRSFDANDSEKKLLDHLNNQIEDPFTLIESYFKDGYLERLVRHQIESYNHFVNYQIQKTIDMFNPVKIHSENDYIVEKDKYLLEVFVSFVNFKLYPPLIHENNGATKTMFPGEAKLRNFTYASTMTVDINIEYVIRNTENMDTPKVVTKTLPKINIGKMPIMLRSSICILSQQDCINQKNNDECEMDAGGYFVIKGSEKTVLGQERAAENKIYCFDGKNTTKWDYIAEIKSVPDFKCISPKQIEMMISCKHNGFGKSIYVSIPRIKQPIELFTLFRALGVTTDKQICEYIILDIEKEEQAPILDFLKASIIDSNKYLDQDTALKHITTYAAYNPINMDRETGMKKKAEFTIDILDNDLFPHCKTKNRRFTFLAIWQIVLLELD